MPHNTTICAFFLENTHKNVFFWITRHQDESQGSFGQNSPGGEQDGDHAVVPVGPPPAVFSIVQELVDQFVAFALGLEPQGEPRDVLGGVECHHGRRDEGITTGEEEGLVFFTITAVAVAILVVKFLTF